MVLMEILSMGSVKVSASLGPGGFALA
jgi:hypothetical protein